MSMAAVVLYGVALAMVAAALTVWRRSVHRQTAAAVLARIEGIHLAGSGANGRAGPIERFLERYGLSLSPLQVLGVITGLVLVAVLVGFWLGPWWGGGTLGGAIGGGYIGLSSRKARHKQRMQAQLPGMLDHAIRALRTGSTLNGAFVDAGKEVGPPLSDVVSRVERMVRHGDALGDALEDAAELHALEELRILAMTVRVNLRYGGSAVDLMETLITIIRQREKARRDLRAMTGETRLTAWLLACLPLALVGYIVATNPGYIELMWRDDIGRWVLSGALAWQVLGIMVLRQMVKRL